MDTNRRNFLKVAGLTTLAGLGGTAVVDRLVTGAGTAQAASQGATKGKSGAPRYGLVIDTKKFYQDPGLGEKVVRACHQYHNVPNFPEKRDEIKWIWMTKFENAFTDRPNLYQDEESATKQLPILCNQCDNAPCVRVCPTKATYRYDDGIIGMDYHRCIGCRFCMAACPYGSRSFNWRDPRPFIEHINPDYPSRTRGVVEKCNFCVELVQAGKMPACVEAVADCKALVFGNLNDPNSEIRKILKEQRTIQRNPSLGTLPSVFYIV